MNGFYYTKAILGLLAISLAGGCVGGLLRGEKRDNLYRFGASASSGAAVPAPLAQQTILLDRVRFASEIDGDRMLAIQNGSARYIKGSRWVTTGPNLFAQALVRSFQSRAPGIRLTTIQGNEVTGYTLVISIGRFEAQYDEATMVHPPVVIMEGEATILVSSDRKLVTHRHFKSRAQAAANRAEDIVAAFDLASNCFTTDLTGWVVSSTAQQAPIDGPDCLPSD